MILEGWIKAKLNKARPVLSIGRDEKRTMETPTPTPA
jgi:hypothetical protein